MRGLRLILTWGRGYRVDEPSHNNTVIMATSTDAIVSCLHGEWVDGTCVCERGYESKFNDAILDPVYCGDRIVRVLTRSIDPATIAHYVAMSVSYCDKSHNQSCNTI